MTYRIDEEVLTVLKNAETDGNKLRLTQQLDRTLYTKTNKVLEMIGGKWDRKAKAHVFSDTEAGARVADAVMTGAVVDWKKLYQFFETPPELADRMASLLVGTSVLEPSAGNGSLIGALYRANLKGQDGLAVYAYELNPECQARIKAKYPNARLLGADFLQSSEAAAGYDFVLMNPPFSNGQDVAHVQHAYKQLRSGGRLVSVTSPSWQFRQDKKFVQFREWLAGLNCEVEELPEKTFAGSGTNIRTLLLTIEKE